MTTDEQAIRDLIQTWMRATAAGDLPTILSMMADDAVFLTPGQPPMRRDGFASNFLAAIDHVHIEGTSNIQEIQVAGDWAYCWNHLDILVTPRAGGQPTRRTGYTLTVFRRQNGAWVLARDANLVVASL